MAAVRREFARTAVALLCLTALAPAAPPLTVTADSPTARPGDVVVVTIGGAAASDTAANRLTVFCFRVGNKEQAGNPFDN